jgi:hypothetical protein
MINTDQPVHQIDVDRSARDILASGAGDVGDDLQERPLVMSNMPSKCIDQRTSTYMSSSHPTKMPQNPLLRTPPPLSVLNFPLD